MKKIKYLFIFLLVGILLLSNGVLGLFVQVNTISVDNKEFSEGNSNIMKVYNPAGGGDLSNTYTADNPYLLTIGEEIVFYAQYDNNTYNDAKSYVASTVYENDVDTGGGTVHFINRSMNDYWADDDKRLVFAFRGANSGTCRIVIHNKDSWGDVIEELYVKVVSPDKIYVQDELTGNYVVNPGNITVDASKTLKAMAVFKGDLNMAGDVPSEQFYQGSGFWTWGGLTFTNSWKRLDNQKWLCTIEATLDGVGNYSLGLGKNGNGQVDTLNVAAVHNKIKIKKVDFSSNSYSDVEKNTATRMINGLASGNNSDTNRYIVYVGENIELYAENIDGLHFYNSNEEILKTVSQETTKGTYKGLKPGNVEVALKNDQDNVIETFYIKVVYPIYVDTANGEIHMNYIHEYLTQVFKDKFRDEPNSFVVDENGNPLYLKNLSGYFEAYYLQTNDTVILTSVVKSDDTSKFILGNGLELVEGDNTYEKNLTGDMDGYKKISVEVKLTLTEGGTSVTIDGQSFYIGVKGANDTVGHFDLEVEDGGTYRIIDTKVNNDGSKNITTYLYKLYVVDVYESKGYDKKHNVIATIPKGEYWKKSTSDAPQFESTSAYVTNGESILIDDQGNNIDSDVRNGIKEPLVVGRSISLKDLDSVVFLADLKLIPQTKTVTVVSKDGDNSSQVEDISSQEIKYLNKSEVSFDRRAILDALNKCPFRSGLDFTTRINVDANSLVNPKTGQTIAGIILVMLLFVGGLVYTKKRIKVRNR